MATEGRPTKRTSAIPTLASSDFVRIVTRADGDAIAASGLLARALSNRDVPFQIAVGRTIADRKIRVADGDDRDGRSTTLVIGAYDGDDDVARLQTDDRPASLAAADLVRELDETPDPVLTLAGVVAAGTEPGAGETEWLLESATERELLERRPGVAVPTTDPVDGLAHSTRCLASWSGDLEATREALEAIDVSADDPDALDDDDHRTIGSLVALDVVGSEDVVTEAATSIGRFLRPYATSDACPFETLGGYADVLEAAARTEPGTGVALAIGHAAREPALEAWRTHGRSTHAALETASTRRYDGLFVVEVDDGPVETVARLAAWYRSPEPTVLAVGDGEAAFATQNARALGSILEAIARDLEADYDASGRSAFLRYGPKYETETVITTAREVL